MKKLSARGGDWHFSFETEVSCPYRGKKGKSANQMKLWDAPSPRAFWESRYYDVNVFRQKKHVDERTGHPTRLLRDRKIKSLGHPALTLQP